MKAILPAAAQEQHVAVLGKNGSGKTFAVKAVHVEPLLAAGKLVAIVDPTSAWWGLRTSADGRGAGFKVLVLGGDHGDLPLPANGGGAVARLIVEQRVPCVMDTGLLTVGERTRWMIDFAGTLYRLNRTPLYLIVDEVHVFAPQGKVPDPDTGKMLHAVNQLASGGRSRGIRLTMITQRPQKLHKDSLTTADTLIAMRVLAPHDREAVKAWIDGCGDPVQGKEVLASLAQLKRGEGWVWYPEGGHLERGRFPAIRTFDSSATPTEGKATVMPKGAAEIDLTEINKALSDAVREAEANDPKRLKARIAELERQAKPAGTPQLDRAALQEAERRGYADGVAAGWSEAAKAFEPIVVRAQAIKTDLASHADGMKVSLDAWRGSAVHGTATHAPARRPPMHATARPPAPARPVNGSGSVRGGELKILVACVQHEGCTQEQLTVLTGYKRSSRNTYLQRLRAAGLLEQQGERLVATPAGVDAIGNDFEALPVGDALLQYWLSRLTGGERDILRELAQHGGKWLDRDDLDETTGFKRSSRNTYLQRLGARQLIETQGSQVRASGALFG